MDTATSPKTRINKYGNDVENFRIKLIIVVLADLGNYIWGYV